MEAIGEEFAPCDTCDATWPSADVSLPPGTDREFVGPPARGAMILTIPTAVEASGS